MRTLRLAALALLLLLTALPAFAADYTVQVTARDGHWITTTAGPVYVLPDTPGVLLTVNPATMKARVSWSYAIVMDGATFAPPRIVNFVAETVLLNTLGFASAVVEGE